MKERFSAGKKFLLATIVAFFLSLIVFILNVAMIKNPTLLNISLALVFLTLFTGLFLVLFLSKAALSLEQSLFYQYMDTIKERLGESLTYIPAPAYDPDSITGNPATWWNHANEISAVNGLEGVYKKMPFRAYELRTFYAHGGERHGSDKFHGYYIIAEKPLSCRQEISIHTNNYFHPLYVKENEPFPLKNQCNLRMETFYPLKTHLFTFDATFKCLFAYADDVHYITRHETLCQDMAYYAKQVAREFSVFVSPEGILALSVRGLAFTRADPLGSELDFEEHFLKTLDEFCSFVDLLNTIYTQLD